MSKFYITTPIYYVNAEPHLGGAYTTIAADVAARYHRMKGEDVFFLTGTDEHGAKLAESAKEQNKTPKEWCDENAAKYKFVWDQLQIAYDNFIRTTDPDHEKAAAKAVQALYDKGLIYKGVYSGLYCLGCERYYTEKELVDGKCPFHQKEPVTLSEDCYFFKLSAFQEPLLKLIDSGEWVIEPKERKNEVLGFLKSEKLEDLAISRAKVEWGIPVPWDESQTIYVWIEALLNYLTGLGWDGRPKSVNQSLMIKFWPPEVQLIGKDILRFHAVIWPAMLLALELPLPKKLFVHGFFTVAGQKMSKSLGNVIDPVEMVRIFGSDATRYLLLSAFPFGQDGDISMEKFYEKYNSDLAGGIGNLVARVLTLATKFNPNYEFNTNREKTDDFLKFQQKIKEIWQNYDKAIENLAFEKAIESILDLMTFSDRYIDQEKPWQLAKTDLDKFQKVMYILIESLRHISWLIQPFMPEISQRIFEALGGLRQEIKKSLEKAKIWADVKNYQIKKVEALFPRIVTK
ncbi:MAG: methionine--tRNA ligase [Patescibacteria group bacterium]